jgi:hypothetical protein
MMLLTGVLFVGSVTAAVLFMAVAVDRWLDE